jgi:hypothetical protein
MSSNLAEKRPSTDALLSCDFRSKANRRSILPQDAGPIFEPAND